MARDTIKLWLRAVKPLNPPRGKMLRRPRRSQA